VWLAERPGDVVVTWQGRRIETSVMVLAAAVATLVGLALLIWSAIRAILRAPGVLRRARAARRGARGYRAVSQGLVAVGSGDVGAAKKLAEEAHRLAPGEPLTLLLRAQVAQLSGDREGAALTFQRMAGRDDTRLLGLHGLFIEARRRGDPGSALLHAEEAARAAQVPAWAGQAVLEFRCVAGDWAGALERLDRNMQSNLLDRAAYRRQRAVLLTAQALAIEDRERDRAKTAALEAVKLAPDLVPAAALAAQLLGAGGELRKAARIIEAAWRVNPHPDLAEALAHLRPGDSARERLARVEALAKMSPGHVEAALAVARAALDAREFATARAALTPLVAAPTRRVAALMAELEASQHGDEGRAREWVARALTARRDPAWTADGFVSDHWLPVSPVSGRLDAFEWKDPLAGDDHAMVAREARALLDAPRPREGADETRLRRAADDMHPRAPDDDVHARAAGSPAPAPRPGASRGSSAELDEPPAEKFAQSARDSPHADAIPLPASGRADVGEESESAELAASDSHRPQSRELTSSAPPRARGGRRFAPVPIPPAVIPLVHAPDDPGLEPDRAAEPASEPAEEPPPDSWTRIRQLFRP
jgi:HemY protein